MAALDHVVINTLRNMDAAAATCEALGFTLTPRGYHSLGSINHLMMTAGPYLELVGVPEEGLQRQEVLDSPTGLSGLVFAATDADATYARLSAAGLPVLEPLAFSRPVALTNGREEAARFRTVRLPREQSPAGRIYFCQHLTPDLVWRPEWMGHANGFVGIDRVVVESTDAPADATLYALLADSRAERRAAGWAVPLDGAEIHVVDGPRPRFVTADLLFDNLDEIERRARNHPPAEWRRHGADAGTLDLPALDVSLTCRLAPSRSSS
ncbi:VOC family protein [Xanthobacter sp. KR7-65]|uniref:VOC family protein n=1 Tax=Xanthobacter sp. KR7-65 TaxID=3156612 RepID=UPI0032B376FE